MRIRVFPTPGRGKQWAAFTFTWPESPAGSTITLDQVKPDERVIIDDTETWIDLTPRGKAQWIRFHHHPIAHSRIQINPTLKTNRGLWSKTCLWRGQGNDGSAAELSIYYLNRSGSPYLTKPARKGPSKYKAINVTSNPIAWTRNHPSAISLQRCKTHEATLYPTRGSTL